MTISVVFDRRKQGKNGSFEVYLYLSPSDFAYISTKIRIARNFYDPKTNRVSHRHPQAPALNHQINQMMRNFEDAHLELLRFGKQVTVEALKERALTGRAISLNAYMQQQFELDKPRLSPQRIKQVASMLRNFDAFGQHTFDSFDDNALRRFHNHLLRTMKESTTGKNHAVIKKYISRAHDSGLVQKNVYKTFTVPRAAERHTELTTDEIERLRQYSGHPRLEKIRDVFLFMINTGFAFSDVMQLTPADIYQREGRYFLIKNRQKTDVEQMTILLPEALALIEKHRGGRRLFDGISNQKLNNYLKELCTLCDIRKNITSHSARHTFGTIMLTAGLPLETVSRMLGHADLKTTQRYAKLHAQKMANDFDRIGIEKV